MSDANQAAQIQTAPGNKTGCLRIKFLARGSLKLGPDRWLRQLPGYRPELDGCTFLFDPEARGYDWLVVYDNLPPVGTERFSRRIEDLDCLRENTMLITSEPSSVNIYGRAFLRQFGHVLSSQEPWAVPHRSHIHSQAGLKWFYGMGRAGSRRFDDMQANPPLQKTKLISTVCSAKRQRHTLRNRRFEFTAQLSKLVPELDIFGRGVRDMDDKAEALDSYCYHIAIENHIALHHWTEKLSDPFLGCALPFYIGAPNAAEYFPRDSFIPLDLADVAGSAKIIRRAIDDNLYEKRLPAILEARRRVLQVHGLFPLIVRNIRGLHVEEPSVPGERIMSRRMARWHAPLSSLADLALRGRARYLKPPLPKMSTAPSS
jgi:hypothetical protein